jgi:spermidine/putrescine transport system ATP-binding protein
MRENVVADSILPDQAYTDTSGVSLSVRAVVKTFTGLDKPALNDVSLDVKEGEFYSLLGPSGCGKTTLLRVIAGFETASSGQVFIGGENVSTVPPHKRPVNMVFQSYALFPHLTVAENVAFGLKYGRSKLRPNKGEIGRQVRQALEKVRLEGLEERLPRQLSGGQKQRVALARALVMQPVALLLDEPLSALDPQIREEMQEELRSINERTGVSFVMVTHDQSEALALSRRIAVFYGGQIEQVGTPWEVYNQPTTSFVASFIGRTNIISGRVLSFQGKTLEIETPIGVLSCLAGREAFSPGAAVSLGFKREALELCPSPCEAGTFNSAGATVSFEILSLSYQGHMVDLRLSHPGLPQGEVISSLQPFSLVQGFKSGDAVAMLLPASALLCFPDRLKAGAVCLSPGVSSSSSSSNSNSQVIS